MVGVAVVQRERNGALSRVQVEVRSKQLDTAGIVREAIYHQRAPVPDEAIESGYADLDYCRPVAKIA